MRGVDLVLQSKIVLGGAGRKRTNEAEGLIGLIANG
jgi:hypothetical protein